MSSWWEALKMRDPEPGSVEHRLAEQDAEAAREYLIRYVRDGKGAEFGRLLQAVTLMIVELDAKQRASDGWHEPKEDM